MLPLFMNIGLLVFGFFGVWTDMSIVLLNFYWYLNNISSFKRITVHPKKSYHPLQLLVSRCTLAR